MKWDAFVLDYLSYYTFLDVCNIIYNQILVKEIRCISVSLSYPIRRFEIHVYMFQTV